MAEIRLKSTGTIKLFESDNTSSVTIASPASLGADRTITLPDASVTLASGTMLATDGDGSSLTGTGSWKFIKSQTASGATTVDFINGTSSVVLDSTYFCYMLYGTNISSTTDGRILELIYSTNAGSSWITSGYDQRQVANWDNAHSGYSFTDAAMTFAGSMGTAGNENSAFNFTLYNPSATTDYMMCNFEGVNRNESGNMYFFTGGSQYETAGDVDAIRLQLDGAGVFSGFFKLYGLSGS
jgi:hypothetical protein